MQELEAMPQALPPVAGPSAWLPADFVQDHSWCHELSPGQADEIACAAQRWRGRGFDTLTREEATRALPGLVCLAERVTDELAGRGFALIRGVPVWRLSDEEARLAYWAIGLLFGVGLSQNARADFLCPVTDMGVDFGYSGSASQHNVRGYQSRADLNYHCDPTDIVALLCLRQARSGGVSTIVSTPAIFNEIRARHPEHLPTLLRGFPYDRKGEGWASEAPVTPRIPVFAHHGGRVSCRYARSYILGGAQKLGQPLTGEERAALDCFDAVAHREDMVLHMEFRPGDIQMLNNYTVVHGRTSYEDDPDPARRRFLYRLWLQIDRAPWIEEDEVMRWAFARFGNLGRTTGQWRALNGGTP